MEAVEEQLISQSNSFTGWDDDIEEEKSSDGQQTEEKSNSEEFIPNAVAEETDLVPASPAASRIRNIFGSMLRLPSSGPNRSIKSATFIDQSTKSLAPTIYEQTANRRLVKKSKAEFAAQLDRHEKLVGETGYFEPVPAKYPMIEFGVQIEMRRNAALFVEVVCVNAGQVENLGRTETKNVTALQGVSYERLFQVTYMVGAEDTQFLQLRIRDGDFMQIGHGYVLCSVEVHIADILKRDTSFPIRLNDPEVLGFLHVRSSIKETDIVLNFQNEDKLAARFYRATAPTLEAVRAKLFFVEREYEEYTLALSCNSIFPTKDEIHAAVAAASEGKKGKKAVAEEDSDEPQSVQVLLVFCSNIEDVEVELIGPRARASMQKNIIWKSRRISKPPYSVSVRDMNLSEAEFIGRVHHHSPPSDHHSDPIEGSDSATDLEHEQQNIIEGSSRKREGKRGYLAVQVYATERESRKKAVFSGRVQYADKWKLYSYSYWDISEIYNDHFKGATSGSATFHGTPVEYNSNLPLPPREDEEEQDDGERRSFLSSLCGCCFKKTDVIAKQEDDFEDLIRKLTKNPEELHNKDLCHVEHQEIDQKLFTMPTKAVLQTNEEDAVQSVRDIARDILESGSECNESVVGDKGAIPHIPITNHKSMKQSGACGATDETNAQKKKNQHRSAHFKLSISKHIMKKNVTTGDDYYERHLLQRFKRKKLRWCMEQEANYCIAVTNHHDEAEKALHLLRNISDGFDFDLTFVCDMHQPAVQNLLQAQEKAASKKKMEEPQSVVDGSTVLRVAKLAFSALSRFTSSTIKAYAGGGVTVPPKGHPIRYAIRNVGFPLAQEALVYHDEVTEQDRPELYCDTDYALMIPELVYKHIHDVNAAVRRGQKQRVYFDDLPADDRRLVHSAINAAVGEVRAELLLQSGLCNDDYDGSLDSSAVTMNEVDKNGGGSQRLNAADIVRQQERDAAIDHLKRLVKEMINTVNVNGVIRVPDHPHPSHFDLVSPTSVYMYFEETNRAFRELRDTHSVTPKFDGGSSVVLRKEQNQESYEQTAGGVDAMCWAFFAPDPPEKGQIRLYGQQLLGIRMEIDRTRLLQWVNFVGSSVVSSADYTNWNYLNSIQYRTKHEFLEGFLEASAIYHPCILQQAQHFDAYTLKEQAIVVAELQSLLIGYQQQLESIIASSNSLEIKKGKALPIYDQAQVQLMEIVKRLRRVEVLHIRTTVKKLLLVLRSERENLYRNLRREQIGFILGVFITEIKLLRRDISETLEVLQRADSTGTNRIVTSLERRKRICYTGTPVKPSMTSEEFYNKIPSKLLSRHQRYYDIELIEQQLATGGGTKTGHVVVWTVGQMPSSALYIRAVQRIFLKQLLQPDSNAALIVVLAAEARYDLDVRERYDIGTQHTVDSTSMIADPFIALIDAYDAVVDEAAEQICSIYEYNRKQLLSEWRQYKLELQHGKKKESWQQKQWKQRLLKQKQLLEMQYERYFDGGSPLQQIDAAQEEAAGAGDQTFSRYVKSSSSSKRMQQKETEKQSERHLEYKERRRKKIARPEDFVPKRLFMLHAVTFAEVLGQAYRKEDEIQRICRDWQLKRADRKKALQKSRSARLNNSVASMDLHDLDRDFEELKGSKVIMALQCSGENSLPTVPAVELALLDNFTKEHADHILSYDESDSDDEEEDDDDTSISDSSDEDVEALGVEGKSVNKKRGKASSIPWQLAKHVNVKGKNLVTRLLYSGKANPSELKPPHRAGEQQQVCAVTKRTESTSSQNKQIEAKFDKKMFFQGLGDMISMKQRCEEEVNLLMQSRLRYFLSLYLQDLRIEEQCRECSSEGGLLQNFCIGDVLCGIGSVR